MPFLLLCHEELDHASVVAYPSYTTFVYTTFVFGRYGPIRLDEHEAARALLIMKQETPDTALRKSLDDFVDFYEVLCNNGRDGQRQALIEAMYDIVIRYVCITKDTAEALFRQHIIKHPLDLLKTTLNHIVRIYNTLHEQQRAQLASDIKRVTDDIRDHYFGPGFFE